MIGRLPMARLAPLEYRYALDAVMPMLGPHPPAALICNVPALQAEVAQRLPQRAAATSAPAGLWIEPLADTWRSELQRLIASLPAGAALAIVASRPLARLLPERRTWPGQPLALQLRGLSRLRRALRQTGYTLEAEYGIHTLAAIGLGGLGGLSDRLGRPDLGDRLHFAARRRYCVSGGQAALATAALLLARRDRA